MVAARTTQIHLTKLGFNHVEFHKERSKILAQSGRWHGILDAVSDVEMG